MMDYFVNNYEKIGSLIFVHIELIVISLIIALVITSLLVLVCIYFSKLKNLLVSLLSMIYTIPSISLLAILVPLTGLGFKTAVIALVIYDLYLLLANWLSGFDHVDTGLIESGFAMGMNKLQVLVKIQIPLSHKAILTGIRLACISTIQVASIAAIINAGGLGSLLFDGLRTMNMIKILWGSVLSALLAIGVNVLISLWEEKGKESL